MKAKRKRASHEDGKTALLKSLDDLVFIIDKNLVFKECHSPSSSSLFSDPEFFLGKKIDEIDFPKKSLNSIKRTLLKVLKSGKAGRVEYSLDFSRGRAWFDMKVTKFFGVDGKEEGLICVVRDITSRKKQEEKQRARSKFQKLIAELSYKFISAEDKKFDDVLNLSLKELGELFEVDRSYLFMFSKNSRKMTNTHEWCAKGVSPEKHNLQNIPSDSITWWMKHMKREKVVIIPDVKKMPDEASTERGILEAQNIKSVLFLAVFDEKENLLGFFGFDSVKKKRTWSKDQAVLLVIIAEVISGAIQRNRSNRKIKEKDKLIASRNKELRAQSEELKLALKDLKKAQKALEKEKDSVERKVVIRTKQLKEEKEVVSNLLKQKTEFINQLSHDLRTPLTPLKILLPVVKLKVSDKKLSKNVDICLRNVTYLNDLIEKTLNLSRLEAGKIELDSKKQNISKLVKDVIAENDLSFQEKKLVVENKVKGSILVSFDELRMKEVFNNLLGNAIKFTPEKGKITFSAKVYKNKVRITIKDTGIGMTKETLDKMFNEFFKGDESRHDFSGFGLGMSICKKIMELHKGRVFVDSKGLNKGSSSIIELPLK